MKATLVLAVLGAMAWGELARSAGAPRIEFEQKIRDFGRVLRIENVSGTFKFKNVGDDVLRLEPPEPSCSCTVVSLKTSALKPGESGELPFVLNLGRFKAHLEEHIVVKSNDPRTPEVILTMKAEYTPLYDVTPITLAPNVPQGGRDTNALITITRTDGKPLGPLRLVPSTPWIVVKRETGIETADSTARFRVELEPDGPPRRFYESINVYRSPQTNELTAGIMVYGRVTEELVIEPEALLWRITGPAQVRAENSEALTIRRATIRSAIGREFELKNPEVSLKGVTVKLVRKESGRAYELVAKLVEAPEQTISGFVSFETTVPTQPRIEVPLVVRFLNPSDGRISD